MIQMQHESISLDQLLVLFKDQDTSKVISSTRRIIKELKYNQRIVMENFSKLFDSLIILKTNPVQEIRNIGNAFDEFLKDYLGNYYQGLTTDSGNKVDFSIDFLIQKLQDNNNPGVKILVVSWITFILAIQNFKAFLSLPIILTNLMKMLSDKVKDVYQSAEQCLKRMLIGFENKYEELSIKNPEIMVRITDIIIERCQKNDDKVKSYAFECLLTLLNKYKKIIQMYLNEDKNSVLSSKEEKNTKLMLKIGLIEKNDELTKITPQMLIQNIPFVSFNQIINVLIFNVVNCSKIENLFKKCNEVFQQILLEVPLEIFGDKIIPFSNTLKNSLDSKAQDAQINLALDWILKLFKRFNCKMFTKTEDFIEKLITILPEKNESIFQGILDILCEIAKFNLSYSTIILQNIINKLLTTPTIIKIYGSQILQSLSKAIPVTLMYDICASYLLTNNDVYLVTLIINILDIFLLSKNESLDVRKRLIKYNSKERTPEDKAFFEKIFKLWSYKPISALMLSIISEYFELSFTLIQKLAEIDLSVEDYVQLTKITQLIESNKCVNIRMSMLTPFKSILFIKTLFGIAMLLPQGEAFYCLSQRLKCLKFSVQIEKGEEESYKRLMSNDTCIDEEKKKEVDELLKIFMDNQKMLNVHGKAYYT